MNSLLRKLIAVLLVIVLVSANLIVLGEYTIAYAASDDELNKQDSETNNRNVLFNSYFDGESHSKVFDINSEEAKIYLKLEVNTAGYVENGTIEFQNVNFKIKNNIQDENIQSIDVENNKIVLDRVNNGSEIIVELPIEILNEDNVSIDHFNKEFVTKFTGTYIDEDGDERAVEKEITNKLSWNGTAEAEVKAEGTKYIPYATNGNYGVMVQTKVNVNVKDNILPINNTNIEIIAPVLNDIKPTSVTVVATSMAATNGKDEGLDFTNENYTYDAEAGNVTINVNNLDDSISWKKNVQDEYLVTYLYEGRDMYDYATANDINTTSNVNVKLTLYNNEELVVENDVIAEIKYDEKEGTIADFDMEVPNNISKGYLYANYDADKKVETEYNENYIATVNTTKLVTSIEFVQGIDAFVTEEKAEGNTTVSGTNYAYNKQIEVRQDIFNKILGEDGSITIKDEKDKKIGAINKETTLEDGKYILDISKKNTNQITISTSAPITEGQLEINVIKALKGNIDYSKDQMKEFKQLKAKLEGHTDTTTYNVERGILLKEPETKIDLEINKEDLTTVVKNENVEIRAVLDTSSVYNALYKDPTLKITLPSDIEDVKLKGTNILLDNGLKVKSSEVSEENGHKVINVVLEGTQTEYAIDAEYKGAIIVLNTDLTLDTLAASGTEKITMEYINKNDVATKAEGTVEKEINIVAPTGVVASAGINNYKDGAGEVQSISGEAQTVKIDANSEDRVATIEGAVVNNYKNDISNIVVLGRIPAQGNKEIDSDNELGSTFTIPLATGIGTSGLRASDYTVYYSDNANATNNLEDANNGWSEEATTASKSYLMVFDDEYKMEAGDKFEFSYDINIPAEISMNNSTYAMYKVYFDNDSDIGTMEENKVSAILGMTTGTGAELEAELSSTADVVREGQYVKMKVTVTNVGETDATDVKVNVPKPENAVFVDYVTGNGFFEENDELKTIDVGALKTGESSQVSYYIKFDDNVTESMVEGSGEEINEENIFPKSIVNSVYVTANEMTGQVNSNECTINLQDGNISLNLVSDTSESQVLFKGQYLEYLINIYNIGTSGNLNNTVATIVLPEGFTYDSATIRDDWAADEETTDGISYNEDTNTVTVNIGTLSIQKLITLKVKVEDFEGDISMIATVTADGQEVHYSNISEYKAEEINLEISELTSTPRYVKEGNIITYNLQITNNSSGLVRDINIIDELPNELELVKATYTYIGREETITKLTNGRLEISINQLAAGESTEISIQAKASLIPSEDDVEITNKLSISAKNFSTVETNTVTNYIEYNDELHQNTGGNGSTTNNRHKITGIAWLDENTDGKRDASEQPISGIQVILLNKDGNIIVKDINTNEDKITTTSSSGTYEFDNLPDGQYLVLFAYDSSNYSLTEYQKDGVDTSFNSDAIDINITLNGERRIAGITDTIAIDGDNVRDIDIGLYTASKFDLRLDKYIDKISLTTPTIGTRVDEYNNSELAKVEVLGQNLGQSSAVVEYKIVVTNEGSVPGYVNKIVDYLPEKVDFNTELNTDWYLSDNGNIYNSSLANQRINPGESKEVTLVVSVRITQDLLGTITNNAEIYESYNELGLQDVDSNIANKIETEDDMGKADVIFSLVTGKIVMYTSIAFVVIAIIGFGAYEIKKHVLNKNV